MTEQTSQGTDEAEETRPVDEDEAEAKAPESEAVSEQDLAAEVEEAPDVETDSEGESPDEAGPGESPDMAEPQTDEQPDVSEGGEAPSEVEAPPEEEESFGVQPERGADAAEAVAAPTEPEAVPEEEEAAQSVAAPTEPEALGEALQALAPSEAETAVEEETAGAKTAVEAPVAEEDEAREVETPEEEVLPDGDPFAGPGDWYVIHTYAGYENKVKTNLGSRIQTMQMQDKIFDVVVPMEDVMEIKGGRKQVVQKKVFPGYLLVKMLYDNDSWYVVRNTPGVTGFVASGTGQKPTPLPRREVEKFLAAKSEETKPAFRLEFEEGDVVRIISGPFTDFNGTISEINVDQSKLKVMVNIFDRETPVELGFDQVAKV
jgi:transcription termination/antitermination protein NusG